MYLKVEKKTLLEQIVKNLGKTLQTLEMVSID